jgi:hypothetical protein
LLKKEEAAEKESAVDQGSANQVSEWSLPDLEFVDLARVPAPASTRALEAQTRH